jgi:hypothetical protein
MTTPVETSFAGLRGRLRHEASLAPYTSWRAGGKAQRLYLPADRDDLAASCAGCRATSRCSRSGSAATRWCATAACAAPSS